MSRLARALVALTLIGSLAGCAGGATLSAGPQRTPFPGDVVPAQLDGLTVREERSAQRAFASVGESSAVARGRVWTLRRGEEVVASVQVAQLKGGLDTENDEVRAGIRKTVGNGHYRWFKVRGTQWVGVQPLVQGAVYLWLPRRTDLFVVMQVRGAEKDAERLVTELIAYQEGRT